MSGNGWQGRGDPMEEQFERWFLENGIEYRREDDGPTRLDFYLPKFDLYIEVKRFHAQRIGEQMGRAKNVVAVHGMESFRFFAALCLRQPK